MWNILYSNDHIRMCTYSWNVGLLLEFAGVENLGVVTISPGLLVLQLA